MTVDLKAPKQWGDLTLDQFRTVVEAMLLQLTEQERLFLLLCQLSGIRMNGEPSTDDTQQFVTSDGMTFTMKLSEVAEFCNSLRWILDTAPDRLPNPTKADDYLRDMSFGDWFETDTMFRLFDDDNDMKHFDVILPKLGMADMKRPIGQVDAIMMKLWWHAVMQQIAPLYPNVFEAADPNSEQSAYNPFKQLQDFHLMLNEDRPQDNEKIDDARLHDVLSALDSKIEKQKREAAAYEKMKNRHP